MRKGINLRGRGHARGGVDAGGEIVGRKEEWEEPGHRDAGVCNGDGRFFGGCGYSGNEDGAGAALFGCFEEFFVVSEGEVARFGGLGVSHAGDFDGAIAVNFSAQALGDLGKCQRHILRGFYKSRRPSIC